MIERPLLEQVGRRFARLTTNAVVRRPAAWRVFRRLMRLQFDRLAPRWDAMRDPGHLASFERALAAVDRSPRRALDLGTGTGAAAFAIARRFPEAEVVGVDLAAGMIEEARRKTPDDLAERVRFDQGDAARLPFAEGSFGLVALANMIPFFGELARVVEPGGAVIFSFSGGSATPIFVATERLREALEPRGFSGFDEFAAGQGTAVLAWKRPGS